MQAYRSLTLLALAVAILAAGGATAAADEDDPESSIRPPVIIDADDRLAHARLRYLVTRSGTMRQMLAILAATPSVSVRLRSNATLWRDSQRKAQGRFIVDGARVLVLLEFAGDGATPLEQIAGVAHEIAHAVELACLPLLDAVQHGPVDPALVMPLFGIDQLRIALLRRGRGIRKAPPAPLGIETAFAEQAGYEVAVEAVRGRHGDGRLRELSEKYQLSSRCADESSFTAADLRTR